MTKPLTAMGRSELLAEIERLRTENRALKTTATFHPEEPNVWIVVCGCGHTWIWDREDPERPIGCKEDPWGCSNCGAAPRADLQATEEKR